MLTELPFILLGNALFSVLGSPDLVHPISPDVSPSHIHSILLSLTTTYKVLVSFDQGPFEVTASGDSKAVTPIDEAWRKLEAIIKSVFNVSKIKSVYDKHSIVFVDWVIIRDDKTASILGKIKSGYTPTVSAYEERLKKKKKCQGSSDSKATASNPGLDVDDLEDKVSVLDSELDHSVEDTGESAAVTMEAQLAEHKTFPAHDRVGCEDDSHYLSLVNLDQDKLVFCYR
ncbi:hypothetical protein BDB00DRAFT_873519 [Zychaea mexicana]|uniref:uncharacterized protein n=1 Tax=Zychaea mexicana TaxID=64656 RepID=UPI0022FF457D|nr:uncharacterized protein BDB00DRAFT_873519 [Zychaea mexicana]KAI9492252.1 hypothetical protein BDB00DRAFT_873519 [Zychaea mexicana]